MPTFYEVVDKIKSCKHDKLLNISKKFANGSTPSGGIFEKTGILYYRSQDIGISEMQKKQYISQEYDEYLSRSKCHKNDVLVAVVGATLGKVGFINSIDQEGNINQNIAKITIVDEKYLPKYVAVFLDSKLGQKQLHRLSTQTTQAYLNNEQLGKVLIPLLDRSLQKRCVSKIESAYLEKKIKHQQANELLNSINEFLLLTLGIKILTVDEASIKERIFTTDSQKVIVGRFDPKKYSKKYQYLFSAIENATFNKVRLRDIVVSSISGSWGVDESFEDESLIKCLTIRGTEFDNRYNLLLDNIRAKYRKYPPELFDKIKLCSNDILIEKSGGSENQPVGRVAFIDNELAKESLAYSNFLQKMRIDEEIAIPEYVFEYLKLMHNIKVTEVMQTQTNGIRNLILKEYFNQTIILPDKDIQKEIVAHIRDIREQAKKLEEDAENIVKNAKRQVEEILLGDVL